MAKPKGIKVGSKVRLNEDFPADTSNRTTFTVVVVQDEDGKRIGLEGPSTMTTGHECDGACELGRGWWTHEDSLRAVDGETVDDE
jgi:hypothetical protein